jgi:hypothetical protein
MDEEKKQNERILESFMYRESESASIERRTNERTNDFFSEATITVWTKLLSFLVLEKEG